MAKKLIHQQNWHYLTGEQIVQLFDEHFAEVTIQPNYTIVMQLKAMEAATLELLEDRTASTVYRIRQTGVIYQLFQPNGDMLEFDDYEDYQQARPIDELIEGFETKEPVHRVYEENGETWIERLKEPRFKGIYTPDDPLSDISDIEWIDQPDYRQLASLMKKAGAFIQSYLK